MPPVTRSRTAADSTNDEATTTDATPDDAPAPESATHEGADGGTGSQSATNATVTPGPGPSDTPDLVRTAGRMATLPVKVVTAVADDIASTARRPDAVLYCGGLAGLAAVGILEWPVAAAVGVGVAVASGRRRSRATRPSAPPAT